MMREVSHVPFAGQKRYGVTHCGICGMVYSQAEPADETILNALRIPE